LPLFETILSRPVTGFKWPGGAGHRIFGKKIAHGIDAGCAISFYRYLPKKPGTPDVMKNNIPRQ